MKRHFRQYILFVFFSFLLLSVVAQSEKEKSIYDSLTYYYYEKANWDSVIDIGKESIYKGYDFYYLRMRMGLAYDYQGNFRLAEKHYTKALEFEPSDVNAAYYKYFAAINGGRRSVAYKAYENYNTAQMSSITKLDKLPLDYKLKGGNTKALNNIETKTIEQIYFEYGYSFTGNENKLSGLFPRYKNVLYSEGLVRNTQNYFHLSLKGNLSPYIRWQIAFSDNNIDGFYLIQPQNTNYYTKTALLNQVEIYGKLNFYSGSGWNINISAQYMNYHQQYTDIFTDSISYEVPSNEDTVLLETRHYSEQKINYKDEDIVFTISLNKKVGLIDFSAFGSYASIANQNPFQLGAALTILPSGNYSLYLTNRLFYYHDDFSDRIIYKVIAGAAITKKIKFEGAATFGNLQFTNEPDAPVVYNWSEKTSFKGDLMLSYHINSKISLSIRYQITQKIGSYHYQEYDQLKPSTEYPGYYYVSYRDQDDEFKFNQHFIILGLNWVF